MGKEQYKNHSALDHLSAPQRITLGFGMALLMGVGAWLGAVSQKSIKLTIDETTCKTAGSEIVGDYILNPSKADELLTVLRLVQPDIAIIYQDGQYLIKCGDFLTNEEGSIIPSTTSPSESA